MKKLSSVKTHNKWDRDIPPLINVEPGEILQIDTKEGSDGDITPNSNTNDLANADPSKVHPLTGPIYVNGAQPGDTLVVKILDVKPGTWGWTGIMSGQGYLKDEFKDPHLVIWKINKRGGYAHSESFPNIRIPLNPFCGVMGVALSEAGSYVTIPPRNAGGNMDTKFLTAGSTLYLPVFVNGALFSVGDAHAAQGDGEVCLTAIEMPARVILKLDLKKNYTIPAPRFETRQYYGCTGYGQNLDIAMRSALKHMIDFLVELK